MGAALGRLDDVAEEEVQAEVLAQDKGHRCLSEYAAHTLTNASQAYGKTPCTMYHLRVASTAVAHAS